jgi:hypothetical protein
MNKTVFESQLLPDGHLYCPNEFRSVKGATFKVIVTFDDTSTEPSESDIELSALHDNSVDFLSEDELNYYFNLEEL